MRDHTKDRRLAFDTSPGALNAGYRIGVPRLAIPVVAEKPAVKVTTYPACMRQQCRGGRARCATPDECTLSQARWFHPQKWANIAIILTLALAMGTLAIVVPDWPEGMRIAPLKHGRSVL